MARKQNSGKMFGEFGHNKTSRVAQFFRQNWFCCSSTCMLNVYACIIKSTAYSVLSIVCGLSPLLNVGNYCNSFVSLI